jgi:hypothetical protein
MSYQTNGGEARDPARTSISTTPIGVPTTDDTDDTDRTGSPPEAAVSRRNDGIRRHTGLTPE